MQHTNFLAAFVSLVTKTGDKDQAVELKAVPARVCAALPARLPTFDNAAPALQNYACLGAPAEVHACLRNDKLIGYIWVWLHAGRRAVVATPLAA